MAIFNTFKASIETKYGGRLKDGEVFFFHPDNTYTHEGIVHNLKGVIFEFSEQDIIFTEQQKIKYGGYLQLHPIHGYGETFSDGVKYKLHRRHEKGETKYSIQVDGHEADLVLNWCDKQKIEWVHGRKINWNVWIFIAAILVPVIMIFQWKCSGSSNNDSKSTTTLPFDTIKKVKESFLNFSDTTKKSDSLKTLDYHDKTKH